jgi:hypothetical protein
LKTSISSKKTMIGFSRLLARSGSYQLGIRSCRYDLGIRFWARREKSKTDLRFHDSIRHIRERLDGVPVTGSRRSSSVRLLTLASGSTSPHPQAIRTTPGCTASDIFAFMRIIPRGEDRVSHCPAVMFLALASSGCRSTVPSFSPWSSQEILWN